MKLMCAANYSHQSKTEDPKIANGSVCYIISKMCLLFHGHQNCFQNKKLPDPIYLCFMSEVKTLLIRMPMRAVANPHSEVGSFCVFGQVI